MMKMNVKLYILIINRQPLPKTVQIQTWVMSLRVKNIKLMAMEKIGMEIP